MAVAIEDLQSIPILVQAAPDCLPLLAQLMVQRTYAAGEMIFMEGDDPIGVWFIQQGKIKIMKLSANGRVQALCLVNRGKCFGTCPLFASASNPANAQALTDVTLLVLPRHDLEHILRDNPSLAWALSKIYSQYVSQLAKLSESLGAWTAADRVNNTLLVQAETQSEGLVVLLTHEKLAELSGTVREVVSRHLAELEAQQIVRLEFGRIVLINPTALQTCISR